MYKIKKKIATTVLFVFSLCTLWLIFQVKGKTVELPNGLLLKQSFFKDTGNNGFVLSTPEGRAILWTKGAEFVHQGDFIFGMGNIFSDSSGSGEAFIYNKGWKKPEIFTATSRLRYDKQLQHYDLYAALDVSPAWLKGEDYRSCEATELRVKCQIDSLRRYAKEVEARKEPRYLCKDDKPCHSISLYRTYLDTL